MKVISKIMDWLMILSLSVMSVIVFSNVILRYLFDSGITWSVELSQILFLIIVFFGAIQAFKENTHIRVDVLIGKLPPIGQKVMAIIANVCVFVIMLIVLKGSIQLTEENRVMTTPILGIPQSWVYAMGIILSVFIMIFVVLKTIEIFKNPASTKEKLGE